MLSPSLWDDFELTIESRFKKWLASTDGQTVYQEVCIRALRLRRHGHKHYGVKALVEAIRYDRDVTVGPDHGFKINDHHSSRMARLAMKDFPELEGFFSLRELTTL